jgi:Tol biopolymer transport system component
MNRDGTERQALTDKSQDAYGGRFSPDGTRILFLTAPQPQKDQKEEPKAALAVLTIATGKAVQVADVPLNAMIEHFCWGPDGRRIAYVWRERHEGKPEEVNDKETVTTVVVCDPDGKNQKTVATATGEGQWLITISGLDWR